MKISTSTELKLIHEVVHKYQLRIMCNTCVWWRVYYAQAITDYWSSDAQEQREKQGNQDKELKENILIAYRFRNRPIGARQII